VPVNLRDASRRMMYAKLPRNIHREAFLAIAIDAAG
jgi:hypothetical protein